MKSIALFFLILGQANDAYSGGNSLTHIPQPYPSVASCEAAGEAFRANNVGLSFPSYSCVPAPQGDLPELVKSHKLNEAGESVYEVECASKSDAVCSAPVALKP